MTSQRYRNFAPTGWALPLLAAASLLAAPAAYAQDATAPGPVETEKTKRLAPEIPVLPPELGDVRWHPDDTHCRFWKDSQVIDVKAPDSWRFLLVAQRTPDHRVVVERGYARIDGLLRELELVSLFGTEDGQIRRYRTFGPAPVMMTVRLTQGTVSKAATKFKGTIELERNGKASKVEITGACNADAANRRAPS